VRAHRSRHEGRLRHSAWNPLSNPIGRAKSRRVRKASWKIELQAGRATVSDRSRNPSTKIRAMLTGRRNRLGPRARLSASAAVTRRLSTREQQRRGPWSSASSLSAGRVHLGKEDHNRRITIESLPALSDFEDREAIGIPVLPQALERDDTWNCWFLVQYFRRRNLK
jgi:hypothetical protein